MGTCVVETVDLVTMSEDAIKLVVFVTIVIGDEVNLVDRIFVVWYTVLFETGIEIH